MSLREQLDSLKAHLESAELEYKSLEGGKKASSSRLRKSLMNIKTVSHGARNSTTEYVKALPTKARTKKEAAEEAVVSEEPAVSEKVEFDEEGNQVVDPLTKPKLKKSKTKKV
jgi:uncharacterized protein (DUF3084 family)